MKTITVSSAKGGSGKSTIVSSLAVRAAQETANVGMIDLNPDQASLTHWWHIRNSRGGPPMWPRLLSDVEDIPRDVQAFAKAGIEWLFIDTPPADMDLIETAIAVSDAVLIPVRTSFFDVIAVQAVLDMCRDQKKPFAFVLSAVDGRFKKSTTQAIVALKKLGPILQTHVSHRQPYLQALMIGRTGPELEAGLRPEIDALWSEVKQLVEKGRAQ
jgi:chromosome partitioning protein